MTYKEFCKLVDEPINGEHNHPSQFARLVSLTYDLYVKVENLEKENRELKRFVRRNVEPDLRYMG